MDQKRISKQKIKKKASNSMNEMNKLLKKVKKEVKKVEMKGGKKIKKQKGGGLLDKMRGIEEFDQKKLDKNLKLKKNVLTDFFGEPGIAELIGKDARTLENLFWEDWIKFFTIIQRVHSIFTLAASINSNYNFGTQRDRLECHYNEDMDNEDDCWSDFMDDVKYTFNEFLKPEMKQWLQNKKYKDSVKIPFNDTYNEVISPTKDFGTDTFNEQLVVSLLYIFDYLERQIDYQDIKPYTKIVIKMLMEYIQKYRPSVAKRLNQISTVYVRAGERKDKVLIKKHVVYDPKKLTNTHIENIYQLFRTRFSNYDDLKYAMKNNSKYIVGHNEDQIPVLNPELFNMLTVSYNKRASSQYKKDYEKFKKITGSRFELPPVYSRR